MPQTPQPRVVTLCGQKMLLHRLAQEHVQLITHTNWAEAVDQLNRLPLVNGFLLEIDLYPDIAELRRLLISLRNTAPANRVPIVMLSTYAAQPWAGKLAEDFEAVMHLGPLADRPVWHTLQTALAVFTPVEA